MRSGPPSEQSPTDLARVRAIAIVSILLVFLLAAMPGSANPASGAAPVLAPVAPRLVQHGARTGHLVCLTFDACETHRPAGYDAAIIAILRRTHTPATLMLGGLWMQTHRRATQDLGTDRLFEIGNHSYSHPHMTRLAPDAMRAEIVQTQAVMVDLMGHQGVLFRPPYGEWNPELLRQAAAAGLTSMTWDVVTGDPDKHISAKSIIHTVLTRARPGSIVIMHMNGRGWHTAEALPAVIAGLRARGYVLTTVSKMLTHPSASAGRVPKR